MGKIHSFQSLGTVDGPGVRFVVFMQGCDLRCACCHNPDTWNELVGEEYDPEEVLAMVQRYRVYFGPEGGVTISGGEPLNQPEFCRDFFEKCHLENINTCLDTAGADPTEAVLEALDHCDRVLLDIKYSTDEQYLKYVGCSITRATDFLALLEKRNIPTTLRRVILPGLNDSEADCAFLRGLAQAHSCVDGIELLPFSKICQAKYDLMGLPFRFADVETPTEEQMFQLRFAVGARP